MFELHLPQINGSPDPAVSLVSGKLRHEGPQLEGHAPEESLLNLAGEHNATADRAVGEWVVRAPQGTRLALTARADRAGIVRAEVSLD
jgi:hypothetical protein